MAFENFFEFYTKFEILMADSNSLDAVQNLETASALLDQAAKQFPDERSELTLYRLVLAGRRGDVMGAINLLDSALAQGISYPYEGIDHILGSTYTAPEIQPVLQRNSTRFREFVRTTKNPVLILEPDSDVANHRC
jgi:hypothetical protein